MSTKIESFFLIVVILLLCIITPLQMKQSRTEFIMQNALEYEADHFAWELQTYKQIDVPLLPDKTMEFYCYNDRMELVDIISASTTIGPLDFNPYFCVIFEYKGIKKGVCLEQ